MLCKAHYNTNTYNSKHSFCDHIDIVTEILHHTHNITPFKSKHFATNELHVELLQAFNKTFS